MVLRDIASNAISRHRMLYKRVPRLIASSSGVWSGGMVVYFLMVQAVGAAPADTTAMELVTLAGYGSKVGKGP